MPEPTTPSAATARRCLGFGEYESNCANEAGSTHSPLWCQRCDDLRRAHITAQMEKISASFGAKP